MPDYQNGKIYKITAGNLTYIGSTCEPTLARRLAGHVAKYKLWKDGKFHFVSSLPLIETGKYEITLIELCPCGSKDELTARERFHIESTVCVNKYIPIRTDQEIRKRQKTYYQANAETIREKKKTYREANAETIREKEKTYREANADKIREQQRKTYAETIREKKKTYYQANVDKIREQQRAYRKAKSEPVIS